MENIRAADCPVDSQLKPDALGCAINESSSVVESLRDLICQVAGEDRPIESISGAPCMPLSGLLAGGPDIVREKTETCHQLINELRSLLF